MLDKKVRFPVAITLFIAVITLSFLEKIHSYRAGGFHCAKLLSPLPPSPQFFPENLHSLLDQSFHYLGKGGTSFAFLGDDKTTVLKLFKHHHLFPKHPLLSIPLPGIANLWRIQKVIRDQRKKSHKHHSFFLNSCELANTHLKEETGVIFFCREPNPLLKKKVQLSDAWGFAHFLDLSSTTFALQKKAEPFFAYFKKHLRAGEKQRCEEGIDRLIEHILARCRLGIGDRDPNLEINFGFVDDRLVEFDLGSFYLNSYLKLPLAKKWELLLFTLPLQEWLKKHSPEVLDYLLQRIVQASA